MALAPDKIIRNVNRLDGTGVLQGMPVSGIQEYWIFLDLYNESVRVDTVSFRIWNFPGMKADNENRAIELTQVNFKTELKADSRQYVLTEDVFLTDWERVGAAALRPACRILLLKMLLSQEHHQQTL